jgi:ribose 5-phosphate isomerase B
MIKMIAIGCDHGGYKLKEEIKKYLDEKEIEYKDFGTTNEERTDYPIYAERVAKSIQSKECNLGILVCRSGYGMTVVANKFKGIRAAAIYNEESAKFAKADDDINVITLGGDYLSTNQAICIIRNWMATEFKGGRYKERLDMIKEIEKENMK